jgi:hypothetical protein
MESGFALMVAIFNTGLNAACRAGVAAACVEGVACRQVKCWDSWRRVLGSIFLIKGKKSTKGKPFTSESSGMARQVNYGDMCFGVSLCLHGRAAVEC